MVPSLLLDALMNCPGRDGRLVFDGDQLLQANAVGLRTFRAPGCRRGEAWVPWLERQLEQFRRGDRDRWRLCYQRPQGDRVLEYRVEFRRPDPDRDLTLVCSSLHGCLDLHQPLPPTLDLAQTRSLKLLLDSTLVGKLLLDEDGQILYANRVAAALFGTSPDALKGTYLGHPLEMGQVFTMELPSDEGSRWVDLSVLAVPGSGTPTYLATLTDVSERHQAQATAEATHRALRESEERFRLAMEQSAMGMCLVAPEGRFLHVNAALCRILDRDETSLLTCTWQELTHPDDLEVNLTLAAELKTNQRSSYRLRKRFLKPDGSSIWVDISVACVREETGQIRYFVSQVIDLTQVIEIQNALAQQQEEYRQLVDYYQMLAENASDLVCLVGHGTRLIWVSPSIERLLGWNPQDVIGQPLTQLFTPPHETTTQEAALVQCRHQTGQWRWMSVSCRPVADRAGLRIGVIWSLRDVEELVRARQRAETAEARLQATLDVQLDPQVALEALRDSNGTIEDFVYRQVNPAACEYMSLPHDQLVGARLRTLMPGLEGAGLIQHYAAVVTTGQPLILNDFTYDNEVLRDRRRYDMRAVRLGDGISLTWRDVTDRYVMSQQLAASEEQFRLLAENATNVVLHLRQDRVAWVSPSLERELGWEPSQWLGHRLTPMIHPDDLPRYQHTLAAVARGQSVVERGRIRGRDGLFHWVESHCRAYINAQGQPDGLVASFRTVDDLVAAEAALEYRACFDDLTGLLSRSEVFEQMETIAKHPRRTGHETALLFCDLDHFKQVNDLHGHAGGDQLLKTVAERLKTAVRDQDLVARIGGDELLVVLVGVQNLDNAVAIAEQLRRAVAQPVAWQNQTLRVSLSIGVTLLAAHETIDQLVARADTAMYQAKQQGRNRVLPILSPSHAPSQDPPS